MNRASWFTFRQVASVGVFVASVIALSSSSIASVQFELDFTDGKLPSQTGQGLNFTGSTGLLETDIFSVSGDKLILDTTSSPANAYGGYQISPDGFDSSIDVLLEFRARTLEVAGGSFGMFFGFRDASAYGAIQVTETGWRLVDTATSGTFSDPSAFHDFQLKKPGGSNGYELRIDGVLVASGVLLPGSGPSYVYFGDGSPTGGNQRGEIDYIRYSNAPFANSAAPEPSSIVTAFGCILAFAGFYRFSKRRSL